MSNDNDQFVEDLLIKNLHDLDNDAIDMVKASMIAKTAETYYTGRKFKLAKNVVQKRYPDIDLGSNNLGMEKKEIEYQEIDEQWLPVKSK